MVGDGHGEHPNDCDGGGLSATIAREAIGGLSPPSMESTRLLPVVRNWKVMEDHDVGSTASWIGRLGMIMRKMLS